MYKLSILLDFVSAPETEGCCLSSSRDSEKSTSEEIWSRVCTVSCQKGKLSAAPCPLNVLTAYITYLG